MRKIAGQETVDTSLLIDYINPDIPVEATSKSAFYEVKNMQKLKKKFKQYEVMERIMKTKTRPLSVKMMN